MAAEVKMSVLVCVLTIVLTASNIIGECRAESSDSYVAFGECALEKESCKECYLSLVKSLLGSDENVFNLSQVFTPPTYDQPTYVTVNYHFFNSCSMNNMTNDSCIDEIHTWLWAKSGAYLLYPLLTFQYISLLFGNAEHLYEREVNVTLDATECYGVRVDHMALLTQRVSVMHVYGCTMISSMFSSYIHTCTSLQAMHATAKTEGSF